MKSGYAIAALLIIVGNIAFGEWTVRRQGERVRALADAHEAELAHLRDVIGDLREGAAIHSHQRAACVTELHRERAHHAADAERAKREREALEAHLYACGAELTATQYDAQGWQHLWAHRDAAYRGCLCALDGHCDPVAVQEAGR